MIKLASVVRRRWPIIVLCVVVGIACGVISAVATPQASSELFTAEQVVLASGGTSAQDALTVTRGAIPRAAADALGYKGDPDQLASTINVAFASDTNSLTFSSDDADADAATKRVEAFVNAFLDASNAKFQADDQAKKSQIEQDIEDNKTALEEFDAANPQFTEPGYVPTNDVITADLLAQRRALVQRSSDLAEELKAVKDNLARTAPYSTLGPEAPKPAANALIGVPRSKAVRSVLGLMLGLLVGAVTIMVIERLIRRIDTRDELADITDLPVLTEIGWLPERRRGHDSENRVSLTGAWAEPYRRLRSAVQFVQSRDASVATDPDMFAPPSVFLVTSSSPGEGKSTTSALLAMAMAEVGTPTVLVGADFRKPRIDRLLALPESPSIQDFARLDVDRPVVDDVIRATHIPDLYAARSGAGTREVAHLTDATNELCSEASRRGATVILDSSPVHAANDTIDLLPVVDYVVLVVRAGVSTEKEFLDTVAYLQRLSAKILGVVLIGTRSARSASYYYDYYHDKTPSPAA